MHAINDQFSDKFNNGWKKIQNSSWGETEKSWVLPSIQAVYALTCFSFINRTRGFSFRHPFKLSNTLEHRLSVIQYDTKQKNLRWSLPILARLLDTALNFSFHAKQFQVFSRGNLVILEMVPTLYGILYLVVWEWIDDVADDVAPPLPISVVKADLNIN